MTSTRPTSSRLVSACAALILLLAGCSDGQTTNATTPARTATSSATAAAGPEATSTPAGGPSPPAASPPTPAPASSEPVTVTVTATGLDVPWEITFRPDGTALVAERDSGRIVQVSQNGDVSEVQSLDVDPTGEGGLLGLAMHPDEDDLLYAYLSTSQDNRVVRMHVGQSPEPVLTGIPHSPIHNGGRIAFGPEGLLYIGTGDARQAQLAQDQDSLAGKILRIDPDGGVPPDNPFDSPVYSLGHRNVQGLAWDGDGRLYASEFGPDVDDEINLIEPGGNYGWPDVTGTAERDDFVDPILVRQPPDASWSGIALSDDPAVPQWTGDLLVASLRGERLWHLALDGSGGVDEVQELLIGEHGRLRAAVYAPDGSLWVLTSNTDGRGSPRQGDDRILRLAPQG